MARRPVGAAAVTRAAVIPTRNRPGDLLDCLAAVSPQVDWLIIVDNGSLPPVWHTLEQHRNHGHRRVHVLSSPGQPPNISRLWNLGLRHAYHDPACTAVAVLNDDAIVPPGWMDACCAEFAADGQALIDTPALAYSAPVNHRQRLRGLGEVSLRLRMPGYAFVVNAAHRLLLDEQFVWWYGDTDLDWRAREAGGVALVPGFPVDHRHPNSSTVGELAEQAGRDRASFAAKWGRVPW